MTTHRLSGRLPAHRKFARSIEVIIHRDIDGWCFVTNEHTDVFGKGPTKGEALADFKQALTSDFIFLSKYAGNRTGKQYHLSELFLQELEWMKQVITWR